MFGIQRNSKQGGCMDQWQGCLAPVCQIALQRAHGTVVQRGGEVVTPEDLLLALLDVDTALVPFLSRWGIDLDELIRTIQCEQPLAPHPSQEVGLSTALVDWLASARDLYESPWLNTHHLLSTLVCAAERFQDKAYVAVLEQVSASAWASLPQTQCWTPDASLQPMDPEAKLVPEFERGAAPCFPLSSATHDIAVDLASRLLHSRSAALWVQCPSYLRVEWLLGQVRRMAGSVSSASFSHHLGVRRRWFSVEWQLASENDDSLQAMFAAMETRCREHGPLTFVFRECSPSLLTVMIQRIGILRWRHLIAVMKPLILITSAPAKNPQAPEDWMADNLGLRLQHFTVPLVSTGDCLRYLRFCQPAIERQWRMEISDGALQAAATLGRAAAWGTPGGVTDTDPEVALQLIEDALNTKLIVQANGSATLAELRASREDLERRRLLAEARSESTDELVAALDDVCLELAAEEVHWCEQAASSASVLEREDVIAQAHRNDEDARAEEPGFFQGLYGASGQRSALPGNRH